MGKKIFFAVVVVVLFLGASAAYGADAGSQKVGILQKMKNAYSNFRSRQQQKSQAVKKEAPKGMPSTEAVKQKIKLSDSASSQTAAPEAQASKKPMTREEKLASLKEELSDDESILDMVPGLEAGKDADGKVSFTFKGAKLEDLSEEDLNGLYARSHQAIVRMRTERIQRQLEIVSKSSATVAPRTAAGMSPRVPQALTSPSSAPGVPSRPSVPKIISSAPGASSIPSVPKTPSLPSTAATQRR